MAWIWFKCQKMLNCIRFPLCIDRHVKIFFLISQKDEEKWGKKFVSPNQNWHFCQFAIRGWSFVTRIAIYLNWKKYIYGAKWSSFSSFLCQIVCSVNVLNIDWVWMRYAVISISISISKRSFDAIYTIKSRKQRKTDIKNLVLQWVERPLKMSSEICGAHTW